jgi:hypothetical protein
MSFKASGLIASQMVVFFLSARVNTLHKIRKKTDTEIIEYEDIACGKNSIFIIEMASHT